jgi:tetratricopeptide (TPR) repeat protein
VDEPVQPQFSESVERKAEELRQKSFQDESKYIDNESTQRAKELVKTLRAKEEQLYEQRVANIELEKRKAEESLVKTESEFRQKIEEIILKKSESRIEAFQEQRRRAEEERQRIEEAERRKAEEEERLRREEEERRIQEERRKHEEESLRLQEEEKKQKEEEQIHRREEEQRRREEEQRSKQAEKEKRVKTLLSNASKYFEAGDYEHSLVEVAKALVNDPQNVEALELESRIKNLQQEFSETEPSKAEKPGRKAVTREKSIRPTFIQKKPSRLPMIIAIAICAVILLMMVIFQVFRGTATKPVRFAVLPWTSEAGNLEDNILGAALAEEVSRQYKSVVPPIATDYRTVERIVSCSSEPNREIFKYVDRILIGGINKTGNNFTIEVKLVDSSGKVDWSSNYLRSWSGLPDLAGEIAGQVSNSLNIKSSDIKKGFHREAASAIPDAYFFYLRGTELMHRRTHESIANAYDLFLQAAQQDPKFANAFAAAGEALMAQFENNWIRGDSIILRVQHFAEAAISNDPQLDRGFIILAKVNAKNKKYSTALAYLDTAATLSPNNSDVHFERGKILIRMGKYSEGLDGLTKAFNLNPGDPEYLATMAFAYQLVGQFPQSVLNHHRALIFVDDSTEYMTTLAIETITGNAELRINQGPRFIAACERRFKNHPEDNQNLYRLARLRQLMGMANANQYFERLVTNLQSVLVKNPSDGVSMATLGLALTRKGQFSEAITLTRRAVTLTPDNPEVLYKAAQVYTKKMRLSFIFAGQCD